MTPDAAISQLAGTGLLGVFCVLLIFTVVKLYAEVRELRTQAVEKAEECGKAISAKDKEIHAETRARVADAVEGKQFALAATREQMSFVQAMERLTNVILERDRADKERDKERVRTMEEQLKNLAATGSHRPITRSEATALHRASRGEPPHDDEG